MQGYTARASLTASGLVPAPGELTLWVGPSVSFLPPNGNNLPPRWVGGSVNVANVRKLVFDARLTLTYPSVHLVFRDSVLILGFRHNNYWESHEWGLGNHSERYPLR